MFVKDSKKNQWIYNIHRNSNNLKKFNKLQKKELINHKIINFRNLKISEFQKMQKFSKYFKNLNYFFQNLLMFFFV